MKTSAQNNSRVLVALFLIAMLTGVATLLFALFLVAVVTNPAHAVEEVFLQSVPFSRGEGNWVHGSRYECRRETGKKAVNQETLITVQNFGARDECACIILESSKRVELLVAMTEVSMGDLDTMNVCAMLDVAEGLSFTPEDRTKTGTVIIYAFDGVCHPQMGFAEPTTGLYTTAEHMRFKRKRKLPVGANAADPHDHQVLSASHVDFRVLPEGKMSFQDARSFCGNLAVLVPESAYVDGTFDEGGSVGE